MGSKTSIYTVFTSVDDAESSLAWAMYASTVTQNQPVGDLISLLFLICARIPNLLKSCRNPFLKGNRNGANISIIIFLIYCYQTTRQ